MQLVLIVSFLISYPLAIKWKINNFSYLNTTQAAIRAGYSQKTANEQGSRLLANVSVQDALKQAMNEREVRTEITQDYVLTTVKDTIERCRQAEPVMARGANGIGRLQGG